MNFLYHLRVLVCIAALLSSNLAFCDGMATRLPTEAQTDFVGKKTMNKMTYEELKKTKNELVASKQLEIAIKYLQKMLALATDVQDVGMIMLELADIYFETGNLIKAGFLYNEFSKLYPGNNRVEYAAYKGILCSFYSMLTVDRDQSITKETIGLAEQFLTRATIFTQFTPEVKKILKDAREQLFNSELKIARFYASQGRDNAAKTRLASIEKEFTDKIANLKPRILLFEAEVAQWQGKLELADKKTTELTSLYPEFTAETIASSSRKKPHVLRRKAPFAAPTNTVIAKNDFVTKF